MFARSRSISQHPLILQNLAFFGLFIATVCICITVADAITIEDQHSTQGASISDASRNGKAILLNYFQYAGATRKDYGQQGVLAASNPLRMEENFEGRQQNLINLLNPFQQFINPLHSIFNPTATLNAGELQCNTSLSAFLYIASC
jgi:hypothetical protein